MNDIVPDHVPGRSFLQLYPIPLVHPGGVGVMNVISGNNRIEHATAVRVTSQVPAVVQNECYDGIPVSAALGTWPHLPHETTAKTTLIAGHGI